MARGIKKHLKRLKAPKRWMLNKLGGTWAPKPKSGPHKKEASYPLSLIIRNKLKYALNNREITQILLQKTVCIDGKIRTEKNYPVGIMDIVDIKKTAEQFRLLYDSIGRYVLHRIRKDESVFKLCKVIKLKRGQMGIPYIVTHDGRTIRYPNPIIKTNDSILFHVIDNKIVDFVKFDIGSLCIIIGGHNIGKIGIINHREKNYSNEETVRVKHQSGDEFVTKISNIFVIGRGNKSFISLPRTNNYI
nr:40S ribosomal protein S4 [Cryptomonas sp.]